MPPSCSFILAQFHQCSTYIFYARGAQKRKKRQSSRKYLFTLLGSMCVKAVQRMLIKLCPYWKLSKISRGWSWCLVIFGDVWNHWKTCYDVQWQKTYIIFTLTLRKKYLLQNLLEIYLTSKEGPVAHYQVKELLQLASRDMAFNFK